MKKKKEKKKKLYLPNKSNNLSLYICMYDACTTKCLRGDAVGDVLGDALGDVSSPSSAPSPALPDSSSVNISMTVPFKNKKQKKNENFVKKKRYRCNLYFGKRNDHK